MTQQQAARRQLAPARTHRTGGVARVVLGTVLASFVSLASAQSAAIVNGTEIPASRVDAFVQAMIAQGRPDTPDLRTAVREELIARELFVQEARKRDLQKQADVENQLIRSEQDILIGALIRDTLGSNPVTDEQIKAEYDKVTSQNEAAKEYRARHILVDDEAEAQRIIGELDKGGDFAELAKVSKDPGSAARGGDLDWNPASTFVPEFSKALVALEKGSYTKEPVATSFGFHVIQLDDTRAAQPPSLESVKPQIQQQLERQRVVELQNALREAAKIE
ncbi:MAG: peptidylprolyl isomerase [Burkholderiaceae bacterium]